MRLQHNIWVFPHTDLHVGINLAYDRWHEMHSPTRRSTTTPDDSITACYLPDPPSHLAGNSHSLKRFSYWWLLCNANVYFIVARTRAVRLFFFFSFPSFLLPPLDRYDFFRLSTGPGFGFRYEVDATVYCMLTKSGLVAGVRE